MVAIKSRKEVKRIKGLIENIDIKHCLDKRIKAYPIAGIIICFITTQ